MDENTPERLKTFRGEHDNKPRAAYPFYWLQIVILVVGFGAVIGIIAGTPNESMSEESARSGLSPEELRGLAAHLAEKEHLDAAVDTYEDYLRVADLQPADRARVCYTVANLALDLQNYDKALTLLYEADYLGAPDDIKAEVDKKIVQCLDRLGRTADLRKELRNRSNLTSAAEVKDDDVVLAQFGDNVITADDLQAEIDKLPAYAQENFDSQEKKTELLKNIVAEKLLVEKARRLDLDKTPEIQEQLGKQLDAMIVRKLINDEVKSRVSITDEDVERFYKAEPELFTVPLTRDLQIAQADSEAAVMDPNAWSDDLVTYRDKAPRIGPVAATEDVIKAITSTEVGNESGPVDVDGTWYRFRVVSETPERVRPFDEVAEQARHMLQARKEQECLQDLINQTLEVEQVKLFPERLAENSTDKQ